MLRNREFPNTRCIIDCSEIYVEKPFRPKARRTTWSNYKHANTFKLLVGIVPTGTITFISKLHSGLISDQAIVNESGFLDKVKKVMTSRLIVNLTSDIYFSLKRHRLIYPLSVMEKC